MTQTWYRLRAARKTAELMIYDEIGAWGISSKNLIDALAALPDIETLTLRINSPGGEVFDALAIYNALNRHPARVVVCIDALCASAATLVALAGDEVRMADNAMFMIHEPWTVAMGNSADLLKQSDLLDTIAEQIVNIYARKSGMDGATIRELMRAETWYTAEQALAAGFVDAIDEPLKMAALIRHDLSKFRNRPEAAMADPEIVETPDLPVVPVAADHDPTPEPEPAIAAMAAPLIARACNAAGFPGLTEVLLASPHTEKQVKARIAAAVAVRQVCAIARTPELADELIATGADEAAAKLATWDTLAARSAANPVDATPPAEKTTLTRAQFEANLPAARAAIIKSGVRIID